MIACEFSGVHIDVHATPPKKKKKTSISVGQLVRMSWFLRFAEAIACHELSRNRAATKKSLRFTLLGGSSQLASG